MVGSIKQYVSFLWVKLILNIFLPVWTLDIFWLWWQRRKSCWIGLCTFLSDTRRPYGPAQPLDMKWFSKSWKFSTIINGCLCVKLQLFILPFKAYSFHKITCFWRNVCISFCKYFVGVFTFQTRRCVYSTSSGCVDNFWATFYHLPAHPHPLVCLSQFHQTETRYLTLNISFVAI